MNTTEIKDKIRELEEQKIKKENFIGYIGEETDNSIYEINKEIIFYSQMLRESEKTK